MKATFLKLLSLSFLFLFLVGMITSPLSVIAQDAESDTVEAVQDNSSSFNDSVQFDDMEPIFYEAADDDEAEAVSEEGSGVMLYVGIAIVLVVVLIVLKRVGKKKS
jgi:hypothetical protein